MQAEGTVSVLHYRYRFLFCPFRWLILVPMVQLAYEEQLLDRRYWKELQTAGQEMASLQSAHGALLRQKEASSFVRPRKRPAGRLPKQRRGPVSTPGRSRIQADFDNRLGKAVDEAVLAYRRDRGRAVEQTTAYIEGGVYILGKIKAAFPGQDWSQLPVPTVTESMVNDEHTAILHEIEEEVGCSSVQQ